MLEYETANPGQDFNEKEAEVFTFDEENAATGSDVARPTVAVGNPDYVADRDGLSPSGSRDGATSLDFGRSMSRGTDTMTPGASGPARTEMHPGYGDAAYRQSPDAEAGGLGGSYRPSTGRAV